MKRAYRLDNYICVEFKGENFNKTLQIIKAIPNFDRKYMYEGKKWLITLNRRYIYYLRKHNFDIDKSLFYLIAEDIEKDWLKIDLPITCKVLRNYQKECVQFIEFQKGRALLSLDIGLGKTITTLLYLDWKNAYPAIIICPAAVKQHWVDEYHKWIDKSHKIKILYGIDSLDHDKEKNDILILNYELLSRHVKNDEKIEKRTADENLKRFKFNNYKMVIMDESHRLQNEKSKIFFAVDYICKNISSVIALTGTPIINKPSELFNTLSIVKPEIFNNRHSYLHRFCNPKLIVIGRYPNGRVKKAWQFQGSSNESELNYLLSKHVMIRFLKTDVKNSLPNKIPVVYCQKIPKIKEYKKLEETIANEIIEGNKTKALTKFEELKQKAFELKFETLVVFLKECLEKTEKIIVFAWNKEAINKLHSEFEGISVRVSGITKAQDKFLNVDKFISNKNLKLFIANYRSAGEGIDKLQTVCHTCVFAQLPWHKSMINQCVGRIWREGQNNVVTEYFFIAAETIEEEILQIIDKKSEISSSVVDGIKVSDEDLLSILLEKWKRSESN